MWQRFWMAIARKQKELWWSICFILLLFLLFNFLSFYLFWWFYDDHDCSHTSKVVNFFSLVFAFLLEYWIFYLIFYFLCLHFVLFLLFFMMMMIMTAPTRARSSGKKGNEQNLFNTSFPHKPPFKLYFCTFLMCFNCIF